jgi:hypothetical protein
VIGLIDTLFSLFGRDDVVEMCISMFSRQQHLSLGLSVSVRDIVNKRQSQPRKVHQPRGTAKYETLVIKYQFMTGLALLSSSESNSTSLSAGSAVSIL